MTVTEPSSAPDDTCARPVCRHEADFHDVQRGCRVKLGAKDALTCRCSGYLSAAQQDALAEARVVVDSPPVRTVQGIIYQMRKAEESLNHVLEAFE